jgi:hypothetical protein
VVLVHVDVEHCGKALVQISSVVHDPYSGESVSEFNRYINPGIPAGDWEETGNSHKLTANSPEIQTADKLDKVWPDFVAFVEQHTGPDKTGVLVAWGGAACDVEWIFKITEVTHVGKLFKPKGLDYFLDPKKVAQHYKKNPLHQSKTDVLGSGTTSAALRVVPCCFVAPVKKHTSNQTLQCRAWSMVLGVGSVAVVVSWWGGRLYSDAVGVPSGCAQSNGRSFPVWIRTGVKISGKCSHEWRGARWGAG